MKPYVHTRNAHNLTAPREIVPVIMKLLNPTSVADIGCGIGTFLYCFKESGVKQVLGIDGKWVNKDLLSEYLLPEEFNEFDLEKK
jgi:2-polyprenyl-3-methyl-5-hydroxy-6-metoxy-1,4-benzoquinol methylase